MKTDASNSGMLSWSGPMSTSCVKTALPFLRLLDFQITQRQANIIITIVAKNDPTTDAVITVTDVPEYLKILMRNK